MDTSKNAKHKNSPDFIRNQAIATFPFLKVVFIFEQHSSRIINAINECQPIIPVLTKDFGISRRSLHHLGAHTITIGKIFQKFPLPRFVKEKNIIEFQYFDKWEAFFQLTKVLPFIAPDHQPTTGKEYFELVKIMRLIYGYWILTENICDPLEQASMNESIFPWICARAWTHIQKRSLKKSFSTPTVNPFIIRHLRAWRDAVRAQQPGELFTGVLPGKHYPKDLSPIKLYAHQWALLSLLDRHPADLQKLLDNWPNNVRAALVEKLQKYTHVSIAMEDQFSVGVDRGVITFSKITALGTVLKDSILARNCMADYVHILLKNENMDVWRIYEGDQETTLIGHVMRCHKNGTLLTEGHLLGNKPLPSKFSGAIKLLQHRDFDAGPRSSTALYQNIESISHRARSQALSGHAKAMIESAVQKFGLKKVLEIDIAQLEEAIEFSSAARKLAQQINNHRVKFPCPSQKNQNQSNIWGLMTVILSNDDIPIDIIEGIESLNKYRKNELFAAALSSVCLEFRQKYAILKSKLTEFQVDALIQTMAEGNRKIAAHCSEKEFITLNAMACVHLVLLCYIFFDNPSEKEQQILLSSISYSMKERAQKKIPAHKFPSLNKANGTRTSFLLYYDDLNSSSKHIFDTICNQSPSKHNNSEHFT